MTAEELTRQLDALLTELCDGQRRRRLELARRILPNASEDDLSQPHDFPALATSGFFQYEDGVLAGLEAARMALRARLAARS